MPRLRSLCVAAALIGLLPIAPAPAQTVHDRVRFAQVNEPTSLNPILVSGYDAVTVGEILFESLLRLGPDSRWQPALATEEPTTQNGGISADGKRITFHLRSGTQWSDGAPVTSEDVRFAIEQILNPKNILGSRAGYEEITAMRTPDARTIEFDLRRPSGIALSSIEATTPLPKHLLAALPDLNKIPYNAMPVGNGPYTLAEWKRGDRMRFVANPRYWRGAPKVANFELRFVPSVKTALLELQTHEVDMIEVPPTYLEQVPSEGIARSTAASLAWFQVEFNFANPLLADLRVRKAIALAIDRDSLAKVVGHGLLKTDRVMLPLFQWALDPSVSPPAADPQAAAALLDKAGWILGADGVRHKGAQSLSFTLVFGSGGTGIAPATIAQDLQSIGIHIDQKSVQYELLYDTAAAGGTLQTGKFDLAYLGLQTNPDPDVSWLFSCAERAPKGFNFAGYCDPATDAALARASSTFDRTTRTKALSEVQKRLIADTAFDPLYRVDDLYAYANWLHGINPSPYTPFWNIYNWTAS